MNAALQLDGLAVRLPEGRTLGPVDLSLAPGGKALLVGPSGSGKSTLLRAAAGLRPATHGQVLVSGEPVTPGRLPMVRRTLGFVPQEPPLGDGMVREALQRPLAYRANARLTFDVDAAAGLMERFRLPTAMLDQPTGQLSGGEKQRVVLVAALLLERSIYVLDEVTSALGRDDAQAVAAYFAERTDLTLLVSSHTPEVFGDWLRVELDADAGVTA